MKDKLFVTESDLAKVAIPLFQQEQWLVYQEVKTGYGNNIADLVLVRNFNTTKLTHIVELKLRFCEEVVEQAIEWLNWSNYISVCVPPYRKHRVLEKICELYGIGIYVIDTGWSGDEWRIRIVQHPKLRRAKDVRGHKVLKMNITEWLCDAQLEGEFANAGTKNGRRWSPFAETRQQLETFVAENPGCSIKQAVVHIQHHYSTDKTAIRTLTQWLGTKALPLIEVDRTARPFRLNIKATANEKYCSGREK